MRGVRERLAARGAASLAGASTRRRAGPAAACRGLCTGARLHAHARAAPSARHRGRLSSRRSVEAARAISVSIWQEGRCSCQSPLPQRYRPRQPACSPLYRLVESFYDEVKGSWEERFESLYGFWRSAAEAGVYAFLDCSIFEHGFARVSCDGCRAECLVAFSCQHRGFCPSCAAKRGALFGASLSKEVLEPVGHRRWGAPLPPRHGRGGADSRRHVGLAPPRARHRLARGLGSRRRLDAPAVHRRRRRGAAVSAPRAATAQERGAAAPGTLGAAALLAPLRVLGAQCRHHRRRRDRGHRAVGALLPTASLRSGGYAARRSAAPAGPDYGHYSNVARAKRAAAEGEPQALAPSTAADREPTAGERRRLRHLWAQLIRRVYEVDPLLCRECGATMRILAFVLEPSVHPQDPRASRPQGPALRQGPTTRGGRIGPARLVIAARPSTRPWADVRAGVRMRGLSAAV
ncbi:MAG TPA: transposase zinc-binding domain-containing protein, partial [Thermoanaerobaculia bacterium]|nr:transposase zinc-binding domain-containing protein [Thermoanaerobaculia bacterium]